MDLQRLCVVFIIQDEHIYLAKHKRGPLEGYWNGSGGKVEDTDKSAKDAQQRETFAEWNLLIPTLHLIKKGEIFNLFNFRGGANNILEIFIIDVKHCRGNPSESEEMTCPQWFSLQNLPNPMIQGDELWLPRIITGQWKMVDGFIVRNEQFEVVSSYVYGS